MTARSVKVPGPRSLLGRAWASNLPLAFVGASMMIVLMVALTGLLVDPRVITSAPAWLKPMKFAISISIYCFTLLWMLTFVRGRVRHDQPLQREHAAVWGTMTAFVALIWAMNLLAALLLLAQRMPDPAFALALRLGLVVSLVGMNVAFLMTQETPSRSGRPTRPGSKKPPYRAPTPWASRTAGRGCP